MEPIAGDEQDAIPEDETPIKRKNLYELILNETQRRIYVIILLTLLEPLSTSSLLPFIFLYIQSFDASVTTAQISILIFSAFIWNAITSTAFTSYGDVAGHDKVYIFCFLIFSIGLSIEAISNSFGLFIIGHIVVKVPNIPIAFAYIASVLPHKYAVKYCSFTWSICSIVYLLGPIIGALIVRYINYRAIFIFNAIFHVVYFLIALFSLNNSIKYLEHKQTLVGIVDGLEVDDQFPICLRNAKEAEKSEPYAKSTLNKYISFWRSLPVYDLWMLLCSIFINNLTWAIEAIIIFFFLLFLINVYETDVLYGTFMLVQLTVAYGITTLIVPLIVKRIIPSYIWMMTVSSFVLMIVSVLCIVSNHILEMHWLYNVGIAVSFGIIGMVSEMCILELQPKEHAGKVTGLKAGFKFVFRAVSLGLVGLFWKEPYNSLWIAVIILSMIACLLSVVMLIMTKNKKKLINENDN